jgi:molybdopterin/thiamine biosynthesis adenylyltransferase
MNQSFVLDETARYMRHLTLKDIGPAGQKLLKGGSVVAIGSGGLGSAAIAYLAAAGIGKLGVVDDDRVAVSNLQRQIIHKTTGVGELKTRSAEAFVAELNPHVLFVAHTEHLNSGNARRLISEYDVVVDGSDNVDTRFAVAAAAELLQIPLVSGAASRLDGQLTVFAPHLPHPGGGRSPRFQDWFTDPPGSVELPSCDEVGIVGAVTGVMGSLMAMEAIKLIVGIGTPLIGRLLLYDALSATFANMDF